MPVHGLRKSYALMQPVLDEMRQIVRSAPAEVTTYAKHLNRPGVIFQYAYYAALVRQRLPSDAVICDWGGQYGHVTKLLRLFFPNTICYLPDRQEFQAEYFHRRFGVDDVVVFGPGYGTATIPLADASVDALVSSGVLEHTREYDVTEEQSLDEIRRVLRPGGVLFIWNLPRKWGSVETLNSVLRRSVHHHKYSRRQILGLLAEAGFDVELIDRHELLNLSSRNALGRLLGHHRAWIVDYYASKVPPLSAFAQHFTIIATKSARPTDDGATDPTPVREALSRLKFKLARPLPAKAYWFAMGKVKPVAAVTSQCGTLEASLASGAQVVALMDGLGVIRPDAVTVHIGCGLGRVEEHLAPRVRRCYGVDISPSMVAKARRTVRHPNVEFVCTNGRSLPHRDGGDVDLVYSFLVFQHLPRPQFRRYVEDAHAQLAPGGHLVFQIKVDERRTRPEPPATHPYGLRYYTREEVAQVLRAAGFDSIVRVGLDGAADDAASATEDVVFCAQKP